MCVCAFGENRKMHIMNEFLKRESVCVRKRQRERERETDRQTDSERQRERR